MWKSMQIKTGSTDTKIHTTRGSAGGVPPGGGSCARGGWQVNENVRLAVTMKNLSCFKRRLDVIKQVARQLVDQQPHPQILLLRHRFCQRKPRMQRWFKTDLCERLMLILVRRGWGRGKQGPTRCWSCIVSCSIPPFQSRIAEKLINTLLPVPRKLRVCWRTSHGAAASRKRTKSGISALTKRVLLKIKAYSFPIRRPKLLLNWSRTENCFRKPSVKWEREFRVLLRKWR